MTTAYDIGSPPTARPLAVVRPAAASDVALRECYEPLEDPMPLWERNAIRAAIVGVVVAIVVAKVFMIYRHVDDGLWNAYSLLVTTLIFSRFALAWGYRPTTITAATASYTPTVTVIVPAMNEEAAIVPTLRHCLGVDYPPDKLEVIALDDGSTDRTLDAMRTVEQSDHRLQVIALGRNRGKRHAMAAGIRRARGDVLVFIDSDSFVEQDGIRKIARYFRDHEVGAVCGHTEVFNKDTNFLTRMQAVRYYLAFRVCKAAEARFGAVMCCSGCFAAYRRSAVEAVLDEWTSQTFLGAPSTFGDDRSLTNALLGSWRIVYAPDARATTIVPDRFRVFMRQQLRWKKSWTREAFRAAPRILRKNPVAALSFFAACVLIGVMPLAVIRSLFVQPLLTGHAPLWYLNGLILVPGLYALYYRLYRRERIWMYGIVYCFMWATVLVWQMPYALATIRDSRWGTRG